MEECGPTVSSPHAMAQDSSPLHMVDVRGQYARIQSDIDQAVLKVIRSGQYINGPAVRDFTSALADWLGHTAEHPVHVVPCANGTDALQAALMALDLKPGDEVKVPCRERLTPASARCGLQRQVESNIGRFTH